MSATLPPKEEWLHAAVQRFAFQDEYDDLRVRAYLEDSARKAFASYLVQADLTLIDSPSGKWVKQPLWEDDERPTSHRWAYRLHGWAIPQT